MSELEKFRAQMRRDFNRIVSYRIDGREWSWADADEFGLAIRQALESGDVELVGQWAGWCQTTAASYYGPVPAVSRPNANVCTGDSA